MEENIKEIAFSRLQKASHTAKSKIQENPGIPEFPEQKCKKAFVFKAKLLFFTFVHIKHNGVFFSLFCVFLLKKHTRIFIKNATLGSKNTIFATFYKGF